MSSSDAGIALRRSFSGETFMIKSVISTKFHKNPKNLFYPLTGIPVYILFSGLASRIVISKFLELIANGSVSKIF